MKNSLIRFFTTIWLVLSEVPGWPDAPFTVRLRRVAPIILAVVAMATLVTWKKGWREPEVQSVRAAHAPLVALEEEVASLRLACSDQQAVELTEHAKVAGTTLLESTEDVAVFLRQLRDQIRAQGWDAVFQAYDSSISNAGTTEGIEFASARARLVPVSGNPAPFSSLLGVFDQISAANKRIDLTRLGIRADEPGKLEVELNLRVACRLPHEKAS